MPFGPVLSIVLGAISLIPAPATRPATTTATLLQENLEVGAASIGPQPSEEDLIKSFSSVSQHPSSTFLAGIPELPGTRQLEVTPAPSQPLPAATNLIVWPESPAPFHENDPDFRKGMSALARRANAPIIVDDIGIDRTSENERGYFLYNSANFITPDGLFAGRYDKMPLVPFGEYTPYKHFFFFAKNLLSEVGLFDPGQHRQVFSVNGHTYGVFICYESVFADEIRQYPALGADVLVNISNDGWYGDTSAAWQHLNMVRMRAIETHRWILRSTNTGVTAVINPAGRVTQAIPRHQRASLLANFGYEHDITFYAAHGDLFAYLCAALTTIALGFSYLRR